MTSGGYFSWYVFYLEVYGHICISNVLSKKKNKQASQSTLLAEDETGASGHLSELLLDLGFHEMESCVQL